MSKQLVAYFSASGVTRQTAGLLAEASGADLHEIVPAQPYTPADLDWTDKTSRSTIEMSDRASRPAIADSYADLGGYDVVYLGFPMWWYREPSIIDTFLEAHDFANTTIVLFATAGSTSDFGDTVAGLRGLVDASARIVEGTIVTSGEPRDKIVEWYKGLAL